MILVFGATGNVGGAVVRELAVAGSAVRAVVRYPSGRACPPASKRPPATSQTAPPCDRHSPGSTLPSLMSGYDGTTTWCPR